LGDYLSRHAFTLDPDTPLHSSPLAQSVCFSQVLRHNSFPEVFLLQTAPDSHAEVEPSVSQASPIALPELQAIKATKEAATSTEKENFMPNSCHR
jgi:hypothetical protein